jgi:hypothetical protein
VRGVLTVGVKRYNKNWSKKDLELLKELSCEYPPNQIAKKLGRTTDSILSMQEKYKIQGFTFGNTSYITCLELANILHIDGHLIYKWKDKYEDFPKKRLLVINTYKDFVIFDKILGWLEVHQELFNASRVEPYAFTIEPQWLKDKRSRDYRTIAKRCRSKWIPQEDARLEFLLRCGKSCQEIADELHRPLAGIYHRKCKLGLLTYTKKC